jgi:hypothetical protein
VTAQAPFATRNDLIWSGLPDAPSWWAEAGRAGFAPDVSWGVAYPWVLAGHVLGAWAVVDPYAPEAGPFPGVAMVETPAGWMDSLGVESGGEGAWRGFEATMARARVWRSSPAPGVEGRLRPVTDVVLTSGSSAYDGNALALARGDSATGFRAGAASWDRGGLGALGPAGRHRVEASAKWSRGRHRVEGALGQLGSAAALTGGEEQTANGAGGSLRYGVGLGRAELGLDVARGYDHHESFGGVLGYSRRDAHERHATAELRGPQDDWGARLEVRDAQVARVTEIVGETRWEARSVWIAARAAQRRGPAGLRASLGMGRHDGVRRTELAPTLELEMGGPSLAGRAYVERIVAPVWSDLALGQEAFLQSTWLGGVGIRWRSPQAATADLAWATGRTRDRAWVPRWPLEELWLRDGFRRDPSAFDFGLGTASGELRWRSWRARGEGFALFRDESAPQAGVDPARGARASLETSWRAFDGDLDIRLRGEAEVVGGRASEAVPSHWIPRYATFGGAAALTLADAVVTLHFRNIENERRSLTWVDPSTGLEAMGEGLEFRFLITWRLYN